MLLSSGKEPEKARERYDKATMKLHNLHNQYVLAVRSAQLHHEHYHENTLPMLLDSLQKMQEEMVSALWVTLTHIIHFCHFYLIKVVKMCIWL